MALGSLDVYGWPKPRGVNLSPDVGWLAGMRGTLVGPYVIMYVHQLSERVSTRRDGPAYMRSSIKRALSKPRRTLDNRFSELLRVLYRIPAAAGGEHKYIQSAYMRVRAGARGPPSTKSTTIGRA